MAAIFAAGGTPVGRIIPVGISPEAQIRELVQSGLVAWSGHKLRQRVPLARAQGSRTLADLLIEDRE